MISAGLIAMLSGTFAVITGFEDLDLLAGPTDFGFLVIQSTDAERNEEMLDAVESILENGVFTDPEQIRLYTISPDAEGYREVAALAGSFEGFPAVVILVGHCGFIELDKEFLESEMEDAWYRWGSGASMGICNFCRRCNP